MCELAFKILVLKLFVICANQKWYHLYKTHVIQGLKPQTNYMELDFPHPGPIYSHPTHIYLPFKNILGCRSTADQKFSLKG